MRIRRIVVTALATICLILLAACGAAPTQGPDNAAATKIVATFMAQITQTAAAATSVPSAKATETESPEETETPFLTATPDPYQQLLSKFRMVSVSQGNLYVRDGMGLPKQITQSGTDHDPVISTDGEKIVFYRGDGIGNVLVINADGSGEKELISQKMLPETARGSIGIKYLTFLPRTHQVLFSSYFCENSICGGDIFLAGTESTLIMELVKGADLPAAENPNFAVSPNGQYLSVIQKDHVDLYDLTGKLLQPNILNAPHKDVLPLHYWLPDSSGLILLYGTNKVYEVWRYTLQENSAEQLPFAPPLKPTESCDFSISPDRNWILYPKDRSFILPKDNTYLGDFKNSQIQLFTWSAGCSVQWSPDSQHFASQTAIGAVDGTPPIKLDGHFIAWLDATHYLFSKGKSIIDLQTYVAEVGKESAAVPENFIWSSVYAALP